MHMMHTHKCRQTSIHIKYKGIGRKRETVQLPVGKPGTDDEGRCTRKRDSEHKGPKAGSSLQGRGWDLVLLLKGVGRGATRMGGLSPVKKFKVPPSALGDEHSRAKMLKPMNHALLYMKLDLCMDEDLILTPPPLPSESADIVWLS